MSDELQHYGIKGMKWGVRKADEPANPAYTSRMRDNDRRQHGSRAVKRINRRMNEGETRDKALEREYSRNHKQLLAAAGAAYAARLLLVFGPQIVQGVGIKAHNNRLRANWNARSDTFGLPSKETPLKYTKPSRGGVFNITTMK